MHAGIDPCNIRDFVLIGVGFLRGPFAQRLGPFLGIAVIVHANQAIERADEEAEERRWQLWMDAFPVTGALGQSSHSHSLPRKARQ